MSASEVSVAAAFAAGVASFSSPCILPLVPAYLSVVAGLDITRADAAPTSTDGPIATLPIADSSSGLPRERSAGQVRLRAAKSSRRTAGRPVGAVTGHAALFVAGFATVFVLLGMSASSVGRAVVRNHDLLTRVSGVLVVAMALFLLGTVFLSAPGLYREWRLHPRLARLGGFAAPVAGAAFAFGWTPCVGPILASLLALSADQGHAAQGALLLGVYSLGLGVPFLAVAVFFEQSRRPLGWLRRHGRAVTVLSATGLGGMGMLLVLDRLAWITTVIQQVS